MDDNTRWIMSWADRMYEKYGHPKTGYDWCRKLAYAVGEEGNDSPSFRAIELAKKWERGKWQK